jgi:UDP-GlcNAc3NAcA epimerase
MTQKITTIVGARPQFIKLAPFSKKVREKFRETIVHTGQHYDPNMSDTFFQELEIPHPDYNLDIGSGSHGVQTGQMLIALEKVVEREKPDLIAVFGDTNSTLAGAVVGSKLQIPVAHVEAGLRSFNRSMPEEINRIVADHCSDLLFAPTATAVENLTREGLAPKTCLSGDIMLDTLHHNVPKAMKREGILKEFNLSAKEYLLLTLHRPYTVDNTDKLKSIFMAISDVNIPVIFPVHPRTRKMMTDNNLEVSSNLILTDPLGYLDFILLQMKASKILTDSGGIQKEAYLLQVPCITIRPETEWIETVEAGWNLVVGNDAQKLRQAILKFNPTGKQSPIFGTYSVAEKIVGVIEKFLTKGKG